MEPNFSFRKKLNLSNKESTFINNSKISEKLDTLVEKINHPKKFFSTNSKFTKKEILARITTLEDLHTINLAGDQKLKNKLLQTLHIKEKISLIEHKLNLFPESLYVLLSKINKHILETVLLLDVQQIEDQIPFNDSIVKFALIEDEHFLLEKIPHVPPQKEFKQLLATRLALIKYVMSSKLKVALESNFNGISLGTIRELSPTSLEEQADTLSLLACSLITGQQLSQLNLRVFSLSQRMALIQGTGNDHRTFDYRFNLLSKEFKELILEDLPKNRMISLKVYF